MRQLGSTSDEAAEVVAALDQVADRGLSAVPRLRRTQAERAVWPLEVVVGSVGTENVLEMAAVEDQQPVRALGANGRTNRSAIAFARGAATGVLTIRMPTLRKTSSKEPLY